MKRIITFGLLLLFPLLGIAQHKNHAHIIPPAFKKLDSDVDAGLISRSEAIKTKYALVFSPSEAPAELKEQMSIIKCAIPLQIEAKKAVESGELSLGDYEVLNKMMGSGIETKASGNYTSPSGKFEISWSTTGAAAIPETDANSNGTPDYVEWTAFAADSTWRHYVNNLGMLDWVGNNKYLIEYTDQGVYGFCQPLTATTTKIAVHHNFEGFPSNTHPEGDVIGAIYATVGHELEHAVQYFYNEWDNESADWLELDATVFEDVSFDDVNDYFNYNGSSESIFNSPDDGFYPGNYYQAPFGLYFLQVYRPDFFTFVWQKIRATPTKQYLTAFAEVVAENDGNILEDMVRVMLWHVTSGNPNRGSNPGRQINGYGFEEGLSYPTAVVTEISGTSNLFSSFKTLGPTASDFYIITPEETDTGKVVIEFEYDSGVSEIGIGIALEMKDGSAVETIRLAESETNKVLFSMDERWEDIKSINMAVANAITNVTRSITQNLRFRYRVGNNISLIVSNEPENELPGDFKLDQNFPNPFNPTTNIRFSLEEAQNVRLQVFDMTGRLVRTLANGVMASGEHTINFDASSLPSGSYLYRLSNGQTTQTRTLTLVK